MRARRRTPIGRIFADGSRIDAALRSAVRAAIRTHEKRDAPVAIWVDGRTALVPPGKLSLSPSRRKTDPKRVR
jgi:hypothetical protein